VGSDARGLARPDLAIEGAPVVGDGPPAEPVIAVAFAPAQGEYGERSRSEQVRELIEDWRPARGLPWFELIMDLYEKPHRRRPKQVEALIRQADVVVSTRLHALVHGLKHGRPVVSVDPVAGGAEVTAQAGHWAGQWSSSARRSPLLRWTPRWTDACPASSRVRSPLHER
jgi:hypothetical protein